VAQNGAHGTWFEYIGASTKLPSGMSAQWLPSGAKRTFSGLCRKPEFDHRGVVHPKNCRHDRTTDTRDFAIGMSRASQALFKDLVSVGRVENMFPSGLFL
jgi:hypothetical protein